MDLNPESCGQGQEHTCLNSKLEREVKRLKKNTSKIIYLIWIKFLFISAKPSKNIM